MITGDQVLIAKETARQLGLGNNILDAKIFREVPPNQLGTLDEQILGADGFGQVFNQLLRGELVTTRNKIPAIAHPRTCFALRCYRCIHQLQYLFITIQ
jgi:magnesium-transporting ATPase (P-type)